MKHNIAEFPLYEEGLKELILRAGTSLSSPNFSKSPQTTLHNINNYIHFVLLTNNFS